MHLSPGGEVTAPLIADQPIRAGLSHELIQSQLRKILSSETFRRATRLRVLLDYLVQQHLRNPGVVLKEYHIGVEVFAKPPTFDPAADSIVRVEAARLRTKLRDYYAREGQADSVEIGLPDRGYVPFIRARSSAELAPLGSPEHFARIESIAIAPFRVLSEDAQEQYLAQALMEEVAHALSDTHAIRLLPSPTESLNKELKGLRGVGALLQGVVWKSQDAARISVKLIQIPEGRLLWSQIYDDSDVLDSHRVRELALMISREMVLLPRRPLQAKLQVTCVA